MNSSTGCKVIRRIRAISTINDVSTYTTFNDVVTLATNQLVCTVAPQQCVIAQAAFQPVDSFVSTQRIREPGTQQVFNVKILIALRRAALTDARVQVGAHKNVRPCKVYGVNARTAVNAISAHAAIDAIIAVSSINAVVAVSTVNYIIATARNNRVSTIQAGNCFRQRIAFQPVGLWCTSEDGEIVRKHSG